MGFFFASARGRACTEDWSSTITPREYVSALDTCLGALGERRGRACYRYRLGLRYLETGLPAPAALVFSELVRRDPTDEHTRRLLGIAFLCWGQLQPAARHLEIALGLLRRKAASAVSFAEALRFQCEAALLRCVLVRLHMRLGQVQAAHALVKEAQEML